MRWILLLIVVCLALVLWWRPGGELGGTNAPEPPEDYRIICVGGEKFMRCPSECAPDARGQPQCRCQDFYTRRGDEPLSYSHSLCR